MTEETTLHLGVLLKGRNLQRFLEIKKAKGLKNSGDVVRLLINEYWITLEVPLNET